MTTEYLKPSRTTDSDNAGWLRRLVRRLDIVEIKMSILLFLVFSKICKWNALDAIVESQIRALIQQTTLALSQRKMKSAKAKLWLPL